MTLIEEIIEKYKHLMDHTEEFNFVLSAFEKVIDSGIKSPVLEVGNNLGGSALCFLEVLKQKGAKNWLYTVDPYGSITYHNGAFFVEKSDYTNKVYRLATKEIANFCYYNNMNHYHFKCTSEEFMEKYAPIFVNYDDESKSSSLDKFSFIFLDGSHESKVVLKEFEYFVNKLELNGVIVVDDSEITGKQIQSLIDSKWELKQVLKTTLYHQRFFVERIA